MQMPNRNYSASQSYRYGFNGKENDNEVKGVGNELDYGERIYDPRVGRFLSADPLAKKYPWYTPFQFAGNMPIKYVDVDGLEEGEAEEREGRTVAEENERLEELDRERELREGLRSQESVREEARKRDFKENWELINTGGRQRWVPRVRRGLNNYVNNGLEALRASFTPIDPLMTASKRFYYNKMNGSNWEKIVSSALTKSQLYVRNATQVTLEITGEVNGVASSLRIRVDNLSLKANGQIDINEAKFSFTQITIGNFTKTLTEKQRDAFDLVMSGNNVAVFIRGDKAVDLGLPGGVNIVSRLDKVNIIGPDSKAITNTPAKTNNSKDKKTP